MPFYTYYCEVNQQTVEVFHGIGTRLKNWEQVCRKAKMDLGQTPGTTPVVRLISRANPTVFRVKGLDKDEPGKKLLV